MNPRDAILEQIEARLWTVPGVKSVLRYPVEPPLSSEMPAVSFFWGTDETVKVTSTGHSGVPGSGYPALTRHWQITVIPYLTASDGVDDALAEREINEFLISIRRALYAEDLTLSGACDLIYEKRIGTPIKPRQGEPGIGVGVDYEIRYSEFVSDVFGYREV